MNHKKEEAELRKFIQVLGERPAPQADFPTISVVMPTFNQGKFIERSILSLLNQDYPNIELIIVDGGSTDETAEIVQRYADHIAVWISEKDEGQSDALNKGFARATGEIFCWLNSDDLYLPGALRMAAAAFQSHPEATVVFGDWWSIDQNDRVLEINPACDFLVEQFVYEGLTQNAQAMFWTRHAHERFGQFDVSLHWTMDHDLFVRLGVNEGPQGFVRLDDALGGFRRHDDQKTLGDRSGARRENLRIFERAGFKDTAGPLGKVKRVRYRLRRLGWYWKRRGLGYVGVKLLGSLRARISS